MAGKKEPPFFNEDDVGPFYYKVPSYETMELFIETLTGTCFELRVSPFETVVSVKAKIQRLEGIPVSQQHLIWNNVELEDDYCLTDYSITEGCTLKLILAMRGGPINTRRVPMDDPIREITEYMDSSRDDIWEKGPFSKQVTFLVYREGDQLNLFRVVDKGDETLTPLSESLSGSVYNLYADDDEDIETSPSGQQIIENSITMNKMKLLKAKMENMNLNKKPPKMIRVNPHSPMAARPSSGSVSTARHRFLRALPHIGQSYVPPGCSYPSELPQNAFSVFTTTSRRMPSVTRDCVKENDQWESASLPQSVSNARLLPKVSCVEKDAKLLTSNMVPPVPTPFANLEKNAENGASTNERSHVLYPNRTNVDWHGTEEKLLPNTVAFTLLAGANVSEPCSELYGLGKVNTELGLSESTEDSTTAGQAGIAKLLTSATADTGILNSQERSPPKNTHLSPLHCSAQMASCSPRKPQTQSKCFEMKPDSSPAVLRSLEAHHIGDSSYPRTPRFHGISVDSPAKRPDIYSKMEGREIAEVAIKTCKEPVSVNNVGFLTSLARSTNKDILQNSCATGRFRTCGIALTSNRQHFQEEGLRIASPHNDKPGYFLSPGLGLNGNIVATGKRMGDATHLPPVNGSLQSKKKIAKLHCFVCGKKTGLTTSFECRCGNNFCASHRYAETHTCTYDYKNVGRRYLQESNPVVSAPKLPKI